MIGNGHEHILSVVRILQCKNKFKFSILFLHDYIGVVSGVVLSLFLASLINTRELSPGHSWDVGPNQSHPEISEQHARYRPQFFSKHFPNDTVYITSVREPVSWFISYVDFMNVYR